MTTIEWAVLCAGLVIWYAFHEWTSNSGRRKAWTEHQEWLRQHHVARDRREREILERLEDLRVEVDALRTQVR
ncbi:MAG: hypothetical protein HKP27_10165 [Myxococcales bacterium]|nr:hypothetical protein [Myxococcales bacterium]